MTKTEITELRTNDYNSEPSWRDNILGNYDLVKKDIKNNRELYKLIADKIRRDFKSAVEYE